VKPDKISEILSEPDIIKGKLSGKRVHSTWGKEDNLQLNSRENRPGGTPGREADR
jgi:hypothetical protein